MERLFRMYRATSSPVAIALLIGVNLIPLVGARKALNVGASGAAPLVA